MEAAGLAPLRKQHTGPWYPAAPHPPGATEAAETRRVYSCLHSRPVVVAPISTPLATGADAESPAQGQISLSLRPRALPPFPKSFRGSLEGRIWGVTLAAPTGQWRRDVLWDLGWLPGMGLFGKSCWRR